jgi:hypothetical protein
MQRHAIGRRWRNQAKLSAMAIVVSATCDAAAAQWPDHPSPRIPRTADGRPNLSAPAPRTADGKPDLSGIWQSARDPNGVAGGIEGIVAPRYMIDITKDLKPEEVPIQPWAAALHKQRVANSFRDNPMLQCLPAGVPRLNAYTHPQKIVQTPGLIVILYESMTLFRQIFMDGRALPKDPQPTWFGYSIGTWEGDTLVVHSTGFNDKTWLDGSGHPHSEAMHLVERFTRPDVGRMDIQITIDDPKAYAKPLTYTQRQHLLPDTELIEYICNENFQKPLGK